MKICKYCGANVNPKATDMICEKCRHKVNGVKRFVKVRDELRRITGLPPMRSSRK